MDIKKVLLTQLTELMTKHGIKITHQLRDDFAYTLDEYEIKEYETQKLPNLEKRIEHFLAAKRVDGLSPKTLTNYRQMLFAFAAVENLNVSQIKTEDVREYLVYLTAEKKLKDSSLATHINALRSFFSWLHIEGMIRVNPMLKIKSKKLDKRASRHALSSDDMERLRDACVSYREKAILELYYSTGCRLSEIAGLPLSAINLQDRSMIVMGKGKKERTVYFSNRAKYMINEYFNVSNGGTALFCADRYPYKPLTPRAIQKIVKKIGQRAALSRNVHPHLLRHTFATDMINSGVDLTVIQSVLGHSDMSTTLIYAEMSQVNIRREYDRAIA